MSFMDSVHRLLHPNSKRTVRCQARVRAAADSPQLVMCNRVFEIPLNAVVPDIPICHSCEERFNRGIIETIHARSGKTTGSYHITEGYKP